jgi:ABC-type multidrug transport system fused ATPase/permease subunit
MKAKNNFLSAPFALKLVGSILIFSSLLDYFFLLRGLDFKDKNALGGGITQLVNQGISPMIGVALVLTAYWLERISDAPSRNSKLFRFVVLAVSALLGASFLVMAPVHLNNTSQAANLAREQLDKQAQSAEKKIEPMLIDQQQALAAFGKDPKLLDERLKQTKEAIATKQVPEDQLPQLEEQLRVLEQVKANPSIVDSITKEARDKLLNRIRDEKQKSVKLLNDQAFNSNMKTGVNSLILSVGYLLISWVGLSEMGLFSGEAKTRRAPKP